MSIKVDILYNHFQENGSEKLQENQEYQEAVKKVLENIYNLRQAIPAEQKHLANEYDDSIVHLQDIISKEYYKQGFRDGSRVEV